MEKNVKSASLMYYTRNEWFIFLALTLLNLMAAMVYSIQAPIFPGEAEKRNATATEYGIVFGCYSLTQFIVSPIIGSYGPTVGILQLMTCGSLLVGLSTVLFGCLQFVHQRWLFISAAFGLRIIESLGASALYISIYTTIALEFPDTMAMTVGILEGLVGLAFSLGPFLGSVLYQYGGFLLPFAFLGVCLLCSGQVTKWVVTKSASHPEKLLKQSVTNKNRAQSLGFFSLMKNVPSVLFYNVGVLVGAINISFFVTLLEAHLQQFQVSHIVVGMVFLLSGLSSAAGAPICSYFCGSLKRPELVPLFGSILFIIGFTIVGPVPFVGLNPSMYLTLCGVVLISVSLPCFISSGFILSIMAAENSELITDTSTTSSQISGLWFSSISLGTFIGPILGGVLFDHFQFPMATVSMIVLDATEGLSILTFVVWKEFRSKQRLEMETIRSRKDTESKDSLLTN